MPWIQKEVDLMWFFPINSQWGILIHEHNYHDYSDPFGVIAFYNSSGELDFHI